MDREETKEILGRFPATQDLPAAGFACRPGRAALDTRVGHGGDRGIPSGPKSEVHGVASSFPELRLKEPGRFVLRVCTGLACYLQGGTRVLDAVSGELGIGVGETTDDGALTLEEAPCLFVCAMAPTMELEGGTFGKLTPEDAVIRLQSVPRNIPLQR